VAVPWPDTYRHRWRPVQLSWRHGAGAGLGQQMASQADVKPICQVDFMKSTLISVSYIRHVRTVYWSTILLQLAAHAMLHCTHTHQGVAAAMYYMWYQCWPWQPLNKHACSCLCKQNRHTVEHLDCTSGHQTLVHQLGIELVLPKAPTPWCGKKHPLTSTPAAGPEPYTSCNTS
jgi:hypothetical protein